jgi:hypothetical protein
VELQIVDIQAKVVAEKTPQARADIAGPWARQADLPAEVLQQVREQRPVSLDEYKAAAAELARLKKDRAFVARYMDGDRAAATRMALCHIIIGSPIQQGAKQ